jgi:hypothetical protein
MTDLIGFGYILNFSGIYFGSLELNPLYLYSIFVDDLIENCIILGIYLCHIINRYTATNNPNSLFAQKSA